MKKYLTPLNPFPVNTMTRSNLSKKRNGDEFLNIFTLNKRILPKHSGELYVYLESLNTSFDVIILTEIGARNLSVVQKLLPNFTFFYSPPVDTNWGGVGIFQSKSLTNISTLDEVKIKRKCNVTVQNVKLKAYLWSSSITAWCTRLVVFIDTQIEMYQILCRL